MDTWVMSPIIGNTLGGFHHRVVYRLVGMLPMKDTPFRWVYPPLVAAMKTVGLEEVDTYILCRQRVVA